MERINLQKRHKYDNQSMMDFELPLLSKVPDRPKILISSTGCTLFKPQMISSSTCFCTQNCFSIEIIDVSEPIIELYLTA